jgi:hypothetical protein
LIDYAEVHTDDPPVISRTHVVNLDRRMLDKILYVVDNISSINTTISFIALLINKVIPLHAMEAVGVRGGIAPTHS